MSLLERADAIVEEMKTFGSMAVAFSGGVDSAVVAALAKKALGENAYAVTAASETLATRELEDAKRIAIEIGMRHELMSFRELDDPDFVKNEASRCYFCQSMRFEQLQALAKELSCAVVAAGTNADDVSDHRPGLKAMTQRGVYQPLLLHGFSKADVRALAKEFGLSVWDKPALACLSSRIPHGLEVTEKRLRMIERAEDVLAEYDFSSYRVRHHDGLARIEIGVQERERFLTHPERDEILNAIRFVGFDRVTLDIRGYRSGSLNPS